MSDSSFVPLGVLEEQILVAVLRTRDEAFGMQVRREIERVTERELAIGAVYATLDRLEAKGLLASRRSIRAGILDAWDPAGCSADKERLRVLADRGVDMARAKARAEELIRTPQFRYLASRVEEKLVIDEWCPPVLDPSDLPEPAFRVERSSARLGIVRIETNCIGGPLAYAAHRVLQAESADAAALTVRTNGHVGEINWPFAIREVRAVDRPRLLRRQAERADDG